MTHQRTPRLSRRRLWGWPLALGLLTASGLVSALVSDRWGDVWSWFALGVPTLAMAWFSLRRPAAVSAASASSNNNTSARLAPKKS